jgi:dipeptide transport system substrate-binding protein
MLQKTLMAPAIVAAMVSFCTGSQAKTLVYCSEASPTGFNPAISISTTGSDAMRPLFNRLVEFERGGTRIVPALAESWDISPGGDEYTFHLRHGVKFHTTAGFTPTREMNADDVIYSFDRQWKPEYPDYALGAGQYESFNSIGMPKLLKSIDRLGGDTVRFVLNRPEAPLLANLALIWGSVLSAEYAAQNRAAGDPGETDREPVGTGPYILQSYTKDAVVRYVANANYWGGVAAIDHLVYSVTPDPAVRWAKLKAGECDVMPFPSLTDLPEMRKTPGLVVMQQEGLNIGYLAFNVEKKPFEDRRVRQAINMAIDRKAITDAVFSGAGTIAKNPIPPTMWSYNDEVKDYPYDPNQARKLLADAGLVNGFSANLWAMPVQRPYNPNARRMAEMIQQDLGKIGIKVNIVSYEWGEYLKRSAAGEHEMLLLGWTSDNADPDNILGLLLGCQGAAGGANRARWCNKDYDDMVTRARITSDIAERTQLYRQAQVLFKQEAPWVTMNHSVAFMVLRDRVKNFRIDPFGGVYFYGVDVTD